MIRPRKKAERTPDDHRQETMVRNVMLATGLSRSEVESLLISDDDLDEQCETALTDLDRNAQKFA
jgi:hypothetical protein